MTYTLFQRRQKRARYHLKTVATGRPRLSVYRSGRHIYVQLIDDAAGVTLVSASTIEKAEKVTKSWNVEAAKVVGKRIAERAIAKGVKQVIFDRGGYIYHGRIKALADAARESGLEF
jgi:large subunit ribosomal protein L18